MLSRVANSLYWMSRYLERANNVARFIDVNIRLIIDLRFSQQQGQWEALIKANGNEIDFLKRYRVFDEKNVVEFLTFDRQNPNSIISCVQSARENARTVREMISTDLWKSINEFNHLVNKNSKKRKIQNLQSFYEEVNDFGSLIAGVHQDTISHGEAWHFSRLGQMLERADKTARMLDVKYFLLLSNLDEVNSLHDVVEWGAVLQSASAFEMYRKKFHRVTHQDVAKFLIFDESFPRAMYFCINSAAQSLHTITNTLNIEVEAAEKMKKLQQMLDKNQLKHILATGLHEYIDMFQLNLNILDKSIYQSFFAIKKYNGLKGSVAIKNRGTVRV